MKKLALLTALVAIPTATPPIAAAQHQPGDSRRGAPRAQGSWFDRVPGARLFQPLPEDFGPLTAKERRELESFVKKNAPLIYDKLRQLHRRDPEAFERRLQDAAPRLRVLRRVFERDERLGRRIIDYAENRQRLERARRAWRMAGEDQQARRRIRAAVRRLVAEDLKIEAAVLEDRAKDLESRREARVKSEVDRLTAADADLSGEPPPIRVLVRRWRAARNEARRQSLTDELQRAITTRVDQEIDTMRLRVKRMRDNASSEVDRRVQRFASETGKRPPNAGGVRTRPGDNQRENRPGRGGGRTRP